MWNQIPGTQRVTLTKVDSTHENLRTDVVVGDTPELPQVGKRFVMFAKALTDERDVRYIRTSPVKEVGDGYFKTENSTYRLEVHP